MERRRDPQKFMSQGEGRTQEMWRKIMSFVKLVFLFRITLVADVRKAWSRRNRSQAEERVEWLDVLPMWAWSGMGERNLYAKDREWCGAGQLPL